MFFQKSACSREAVDGSASSSMPREASPPLVAATMSGRPSAGASRLMVSSYATRHKNISNTHDAVSLFDDPAIAAITGTWSRIEVTGALVRAARAGGGGRPSSWLRADGVRHPGDQLDEFVPRRTLRNRGPEPRLECLTRTLFDR